MDRLLLFSSLTNNAKLLKNNKFTKGAFFLVELFVANLLQYEHTASSFDTSIPTRKNT